MADSRPVEERERLMKRALGLHTAVDRLERQGAGDVRNRRGLGA
jgi:hypothetical protein